MSVRRSFSKILENTILDDEDDGLGDDPVAAVLGMAPGALALGSVPSAPDLRRTRSSADQLSDLAEQVLTKACLIPSS